MLHTTDETNFDAGTSEIWENSNNFPKFQMSPRQNQNRQLHAALAIEATELNLDFFGMPMMSNPPQMCGGVAHKMNCNFTMTIVGAMLK